MIECEIKRVEMQIYEKPDDFRFKSSFQFASHNFVFKPLDNVHVVLGLKNNNDRADYNLFIAGAGTYIIRPHTQIT